jgi:hypothetical protein
MGKDSTNKIGRLRALKEVSNCRSLNPFDEFKELQEDSSSGLWRWLGKSLVKVVIEKSGKKSTGMRLITLDNGVKLSEEIKSKRKYCTNNNK